MHGSAGLSAAGSPPPTGYGTPWRPVRRCYGVGNLLWRLPMPGREPCRCSNTATYIAWNVRMGCLPLADRPGSGSAPAIDTSTTYTRGTGFARNSTGPRRIPPMSSGVTSAGTTPTRPRASSHSGSALETWVIADAIQQPPLPRYCACAAGQASPALAPALDAPSLG